MRFRSRTWFLLSLLLFAAAYWCWTLGNALSESRAVRARAALPVAVRPPAPAPTPVAQVKPSPTPSQPLSYRVSNTRKTEQQLLRSNHAIILRNALIDTDRPLKLNIPAHLRAKGAPGSYIVQSESALDQRFRDKLQKEGVTFVSYIPNDAALVQATPEQARAMASDQYFQAVLPYEPYYKIAPNLLPEAIAQDQSQSEALNVTALPGQRDATLAALQGLGAQLMGEDEGPFGTTLSVMVPPEQLVAVAQLPLAKEIESYMPRRLLNDLTRVALGISTGPYYTNANYLNLNGAGVTVNMNDTGVDATHPDFSVSGSNGATRLLGSPNALYDYSGHGTHVAGIIMGNGVKSASVTNPVPGSFIPGAGFQGKATNALLYVQSLNLGVGATIADSILVGGSVLADAQLQSTASVNLGPTNLISNNSWGYPQPINETFPPPPYDMHAASFDQATRDAQPNVPGEQPLLFVFAAGGYGNGDVFGGNGASGSIYSPATAKNVITVGSLDAPRFITNNVVIDGQTNDDYFFDWTDNGNLVAWFSSCGNVGAGIEGTSGRFKPDVVAPGVFTISCRASNYVDPTNATYFTPYPFPGQILQPGRTNNYNLNIPTDTLELLVYITPNAASPAPFPDLDFFADGFTPPIDLRSAGNSALLSFSNYLTPGEWYFAVTAPQGQVQPVSYDLSFYLIETNNLGATGTNTGGYFNVVSNLNSALKPYYVYQYGTSMSAGAISGMLALMQEFLQTKMNPPMPHPSPALLKALLINGSRSAEQQYDFNTQPTSANEQGWGLPNLPNSLPASLASNGAPSLLMLDQSPGGALATGQSQSFTINSTDPKATNYPVRISLVWTDPPGDPAAGIALVNNLDLVVTDASGTNLWLGNDFYSGDIFSEVDTTNLPDVINNVQNVYIGSTNAPVEYKFPLTVSVLGMRVNVNAATTASNLIAQDYALVISSDDPKAGLTLASNTPAPTYQPINLTMLETVTNGFGYVLSPTNDPPLWDFAHSNNTLVTSVSNGVPLLHQRVGANEPNLYANGALYANSVTNTNGNAVQWHFFVFPVSQFTNTDQTNVAFTTFNPPDLATQISPRTNGADLDMYVSTDPSLTNLNPAAIAASVASGWASLSRGGTETVIFTNAAITTYYIGIKSEDQEAGDFGFYAVAQQQPFSSQDPFGNTVARGTGLPRLIPDADDGPPAMDFAFMINPANPRLILRNVIVNLGIAHDNPSDLYGTLQHDQAQVVLNNYSGAPGGFYSVYDDLQDTTGLSSAGVVPTGDGPVPADGPGTLRSYVSGPGQGMWMITEADNAILQTGAITNFSVTGIPQPLGLNFQVTLGPQSWFDDYVLVPNDATNMDISAVYVAGSGPIGIFITNQDNVTFNDYGSGPIVPTGGYLSYGITNHPPLDGGYWYFGIYNSNTTASVTLNVSISFQLSDVPNLVQSFTNTPTVPLPISTDATTSSQCISGIAGQQLINLSVGVRLDDPNLDDLVLQLTSPQGTSLILFENRGGLDATNLGLTLTNGGFVYTTFTENTNLASEPIKFATPPYATPVTNPATVISSNNFNAFTNSLGTLTGAGNYTNGDLVDGWLVETNLLVVSNELTNVVTGKTTNQVTIQVTNQAFNEVSLVTDPSYASDGANSSTNYLALASGRLSQTFTTVPGANYELRYHARSPGLTDWWPGDNTTIDLVNTNTATIPYHDITYDVGEVGRSFTFDGVSPNNNYTGDEVDFGTNVSNFGTNEFTVEFWIKQPANPASQVAILEKRPECDDNLSAWDIKCGEVRYSGVSSVGRLFMEACSANALNVGLWVSSKPIDDGIYHHVAFARQGTNLLIYMDGALDTNMFTGGNGVFDMENPSMFRAGNSVCVSPGMPNGEYDSTQPFTGDMDEIDLWQRALSPAEIHAIYAAGSAGKYSTNSLYPNFDLTIDGLSTNTIILQDFVGGWKGYTNSFTASSNQTTIELAGNPMGVLFDDFELIQLPSTNYNNYFLPEEPLTPFIGQNPVGCWTLSVLDTRQDSTAPVNGKLYSWTLQVTTSSTNVDLVVLTNGIAYTNTATNGIAYFGIDVPVTANYATNILFNSSGPMNLLFNQSALPTGNLPGDVNLLTLNAASAGPNAATLTTQGAPPPLMPGQRYFLGVQNTGGGLESFNIEVQFDVSTNTNIVALASSVPVSTNISTNGPSFYSFTVPTNAIMATFQLLSPTNGQADLYVREGLPVPGPLSFDYASLNQGTNDQYIVVTTNSLPVPLPIANTNDPLPLKPTTWYLSVYNFAGVSNVGYTVLASYVTTNGVNALKIIDLNTQSNYTYFETNAPGAPPGFPTNLMYSFTISNPKLESVEFTVTNIGNTGSLSLLAGDGTFPTPDNFYTGSFAPTAGTSATSVVIVTNSSLTSLSNIWYLAVPNTAINNTDIKYSITAVVTNAPVVSYPLFLGATITSPSSGFTMYWTATAGQSYEIDVSTNLTSWIKATTITAQSSTASYTDSVPVISQTSRFFRIVTP